MRDNHTSLWHFRCKENKKELLSRHKLGQPGYTRERQMQGYENQLTGLPKKTNSILQDLTLYKGPSLSVLFTLESSQCNGEDAVNALHWAYGSIKHKYSRDTLSQQPRLNSERFKAWENVAGRGFHQQPKASSEADKKEQRVAAVEGEPLHCMWDLKSGNSSQGIGGWW